MQGFLQKLRMRLSSILILILVFGLGLAIVSDGVKADVGNTYYVAPSGDERTGLKDEGTLENPFRTLDRAMESMKPGDTLIIRGGRYKEQIDLYNKNGSINAWFTVKNYPGEKVVLDGENSIGEGIIFNTSSYWKIEGIEFTRYTGAGIYIKDKCHHFDLNHLKIYDLDGPVGSTAGTEGIMGYQDTSYVTVRNSEIFNVGLDQKKQKDHGIYIGYGAHHWTFDSNVIYNNSGAAIQMNGEPNGGSYCTLTNNVLHSNLQWGLVLGSHATGTVVENNTFYGNLDSDVYLLQSATGNTFRNNVFGSYGAKYSVAISDTPSLQNTFDLNSYRKMNDRVVFAVTDNITFTQWQGQSQEARGQYLNAPLSDEEKTIILPSGKNYVSKRLAGSNRYETGTRIAEEYNSGILDHVVIASGLDFPDALSGSVLAFKLKAPILLVGATPEESGETFAYIKSHLSQDGTLFILGGAGAVSESFVTTLQGMGFQDHQIKRLGGASRYATNLAINEEMSVAQGNPVVIASGNGFADALSISSVAAAKGYPIILTDSTLSEEAEQMLLTIRPSQVYIAGGEGAVSTAIRTEVIALTGLGDEQIIRIGGANRYVTSLNIAKHFKLTGDTVTFAYGENFPDALAGSVLAAKLNAPILLISPEDWLEAKRYMDDTPSLNQVIFGGPGVIGDPIKDGLSR